MKHDNYLFKLSCDNDSVNTDRFLCQILFVLTALLRKYNQVVQRYFVQYLAGYDAVLLNQLIQVLSAECTVLSNSIYQIVTTVVVLKNQCVMNTNTCYTSINMTVSESKLNNQ